MDIKTVKKLIKDYQQKNALYVGHVWGKSSVGIILKCEDDNEELEEWNPDYDMGDEPQECPVYEVYCLPEGTTFYITQSELEGANIREIAKAKLKRFDNSRYSKSIEYEYEYEMI